MYKSFYYNRSSHSISTIFRFLKLEFLDLLWLSYLCTGKVVFPTRYQVNMCLSFSFSLGLLVNLCLTLNTHDVSIAELDSYHSLPIFRCTRSMVPRRSTLELRKDCGIGRISSRWCYFYFFAVFSCFCRVFFIFHSFCHAAGNSARKTRRYQWWYLQLTKILAVAVLFLSDRFVAMHE